MKKGKNIMGFLGKDTEFNGALTFDGGIRLDGRFKGEIKGGESLIIGQEGVVEAEINVPYVIILGKVKGNIFAEKKVHIHSKGMVDGIIQSPNLVIDEGGIFNGQCLMQVVDQMDEEKVIMLLSQKKVGMVG